MKITILAIGKMKKDSPEYRLIAGYVKQCGWPITIKEYDEKKRLSGPEMKRAESALLIQNIPANAAVVVLDEKGRTFTSRDFSKRLVTWQDNGFSEIVFVIGGADGHTDDIRLKADLILSMGQWTLPHMLARVVLVEQIFRAKCIADNHPYHRD